LKVAAQRVEEAQLFVEAAHSCEARLAAQATAIAEKRDDREPANA
jgi:hypothetical protein